MLKLIHTRAGYRNLILISFWVISRCYIVNVFMNSTTWDSWGRQCVKHCSVDNIFIIQTLVLYWKIRHQESGRNLIRDPGGKFSIFDLTSEDIEDVISPFFMVDCASPYWRNNSPELTRARRQESDFLVSRLRRLISRSPLRRARLCSNLSLLAG